MFHEEVFLDYVRETLAAYDGHGGSAKTSINYSRFDHTRRVYCWALRLAEDYEDSIDLETLRIAAIFHDIGYSVEKDLDHHAEHSAAMCREYLKKSGYPDERTEFICDLIAKHSDKTLLFGDIPMELVLLQEADLLDDTGAHGIVMDAWIEAYKENVSFESILAHIKRFTWRDMQNNPMRTEKARRIWEEKQNLTNRFVTSLAEDLACE